MRVGVLLLRAVELFHTLGGLLAAQARATHELLHPAMAGMDIESLCVEPVVHQAPDHHRTEAQDVGHPHDVLAEPCHVCGESKNFLPSGAAAGALRFQRCGMSGLIPSNIPGHKRGTSAKHRCMPHRRSVLHWSTHDGVGVGFAALRTAAAGLVFDECSGRGG